MFRGVYVAGEVKKKQSGVTGVTAGEGEADGHPRMPGHPEMPVCVAELGEGHCVGDQNCQVPFSLTPLKRKKDIPAVSCYYFLYFNLSCTHTHTTVLLMGACCKHLEAACVLWKAPSCSVMGRCR